MTATVYTLGHSTHDEGVFVDMLQGHGITAVADCRSAPFSRRMPHFCKDAFTAFLKAAGIAYVFLGRELGARSDDEHCYVGERISFDRLAQTEPFGEGLARIEKGAEAHTIALVCAEGDPLYCHRAVLVAPQLRARGLVVEHVLADGAIESHTAFERRMLGECRLGEGDLFESHDSKLARAYRAWGDRIAYRRPAPKS